MSPRCRSTGQVARTNTGAGVNNTCTGTVLWNTLVGSQVGQNFTDVALRTQFAF